MGKVRKGFRISEREPGILVALSYIRDLMKMDQKDFYYQNID